jgi:hypothetical protein
VIEQVDRLDQATRRRAAQVLEVRPGALLVVITGDAQRQAHVRHHHPISGAAIAPRDALR